MSIYKGADVSLLKQVSVCTFRPPERYMIWKWTFHMTIEDVLSLVYVMGSLVLLTI